MSTPADVMPQDGIEDRIAFDPSWAATAMLQADTAKTAFGIRLRALERGRAELAMTVRDDMVNGFGITHGGMVFTLADTAFAYACNEGEHAVVASGVDITFTRASRAGDTLTAVAERRWVSGRNGLYDITVRDQRGDTIAEFRGRSFATDRPLPPLTDP
ncbi:hydroxyphenylacetyl-CoA thioesterase PaaI [Leucobacter chromiiresistens]|uniref:Acyl-CoA thioesterase n=1 Tax=Leucobacter chromiiresistens TaxID=1079994 RepID=A0A1H0Y5A0_9MICO|nr:hydroxyphenylacetyl-CoA thioesterase PaaI [Leucobacter chromiiresistens]SDQ10166.1 acyl-CoA thioesterase [Leucobacter chromiiresistens]